MPSSTTKHAAQCNDDQQRQDQTQINARIDDGAHVTPNKRPSGIPTARRSPSLSHLSSNGAPKWRTGARTAATTQPSVGVSTIYAEPEHVHLKDASRTASRLSASVMKRASQESMARQAEGAAQQPDSESAQRALRSTSPHSQLPVRASSSKVRIASLGTISGSTRMRSASTASTTSIITQNLLTSPATTTTSTSTPDTLVSGFSTNSGAPASAATTLQAASESATPSSVKSASWFTSLTKPKNVSTEGGGTARSPSTPMLPTLSVNIDSDLLSIESSTAPVMSESPEAQPPPILQVQPPTPALAQGPNMAFEEHLPAILESNPGSPPLSPSPTSLPHAVSTSPSPQRIPSGVPHGATKSASTPVSPTLHSRAATPPPASASTSAIAVPKPKRSWFGTPSRPTTPTSRPQSRAGSAPASPSKFSSVQPRTASTPEPSRTPTPAPATVTLNTPQDVPPCPTTPPPVYPLALQLDVDTVVDRDAMRAPPSGGEDGAAVDEEPPIYIASEKAAGARSRVVSVSTNTATAQSTSAAEPRKEQQMPTKRASPGSVDDIVPSLPHTPTEDTAGAGSSSGSSRGGGAARFVLSLPLLGRAKLPLGVMLGASGAGSVPADLERDPSSSSQLSDSTANPDSIAKDGPMDANAVKETRQVTPSTDADRPSIQQDSTSANSNTMPDAGQASGASPPSGPEGATGADARAGAGASWWNYVGWTTASTTSLPSANGVSASNDVPVAAPVSEASDSTPDAPEPTRDVDAPAPGISPAKEEEGPKESNEAPIQAGQARDGDDRSEEPPAQQVAMWYAPWAWYSPSPSRARSLAAAEDPPSAATAPIPDPAPDPQSSSSTPPLDLDPPTALPPVEPGPVLTPALVWEPESTITTSLSNWAAYFTARSRVKMLGGRTIEPSDVVRDSNGVEVMEVDFDDDVAPDARGRTGSMSVPNATRLITDRSRSTSRARSPAAGRASPNAGVTTTTSSTLTTTTTMSTTTTTTSAPPTRPSSPAPAYPKKPPAAPAPPNLVLPTWADTFFVAPRSVLPPRAPSPPSPESPKASHDDNVLSKTLKLVGSVLFATGAPPPSAPPSPSSPTSPSRRRHPHPTRPSRLARVASASSGVSMAVDSDDSESEGTDVLERHRQAAFRAWGQELPKAWRVLQEGMSEQGGSRPKPVDSSPRKVRRRGSWGANDTGPERIDANASAEAGGMHDVLRGCRRVVVIGIHGWFPGAMIRTVLGEPTGTSAKFANMTEQALHAFEVEHGVQLEKITKIPLEGDGTIERRVDKLYTNLLANSEWITDLHAADAIIVATHSQGSIVSTHLLDRLICDGHIVTRKNIDAVRSDALKNIAMAVGEGGVGGGVGAGAAGADGAATRQVQRVCCLALCGIHLGPLRYLSSSTLVGPYLQYFESTAARELFEFQNTDSAVSKAYVAALESVVNHGTKIVYVASLNDQVVPIYSGLFTAVSHPLILRALYIDGDAYHSSDFLSNLLVLLLRILNAGIPDSGLIAHLSEATAGSLNGVGHSAAYEELATYSLAVKYLFLANEGDADRALVLEPFNATNEQNDYEIPWALRDVIADARVAHFFGREIGALRDAFREWHPKTAILRDLKRKLQPITRLPSAFSSTMGGGNPSLLGESKL